MLSCLGDTAEQAGDYKMTDRWKGVTGHRYTLLACSALITKLARLTTLGSLKLHWCKILMCMSHSKMQYCAYALCIAVP